MNGVRGHWPSTGVDGIEAPIRNSRARAARGVGGANAFRFGRARALQAHVESLDLEAHQVRIIAADAATDPQVRMRYAQELLKAILRNLVRER